MPGLHTHSRTKGFTLVELLVVVLVLGVISAIVVPAFTGAGAANARAMALLAFAQNSQAIVRVVIPQLQLPYIIEGSNNGNNMIVPGRSWLDVIAYGEAEPRSGDPIIKPAFRGRYRLTGAASLSSSMQLAPGATTDDLAYTVQGYRLALTQEPQDTDGNPIGPPIDDPRIWAFNFFGVSDEVVLALYTRLVDPSTAQLNPAGDAGNSLVRYSARRPDGLYDVVLTRFMR